MKLLALLPILFLGCSTMVYDRTTGKAVLRTYADAQNLTYSADGSFHADSLIHSKPTQAAFDGVAKATTAGGAAGALFFPRP